MRSLSTVSRVYRLVYLAFPLVAFELGCEGETGFSKAPDQPVIEEGQGEITVEPMPIRIEGVDWEAGTPRGQVVTVRNDGDNTLRVHDIGLTSNAGGALYLEEVGELSQQESSKFRVIDPSGTVMVSVELAHSGDRQELAGLESMAPLLAPLFDEVLRGLDLPPSAEGWEHVCAELQYDAGPMRSVGTAILPVEGQAKNSEEDEVDQCLVELF